MVSLGWVFEGLCLVEKRQLLLATIVMWGYFEEKKQTDLMDHTHHWWSAVPLASDWKFG